MDTTQTRDLSGLVGCVPGEPTSLVNQLAKHIREQAITCCLWKGTFDLGKTLRGEKDVDLLVSRADRNRLLGVLRQLNFKQAESHQVVSLPGCSNHFGYDAPSGGFLHVHLHDTIICGRPLENLYRLPWEEEYLATSQPGTVLPIPTPEFELIVFCLRMALAPVNASISRWKFFRPLNMTLRRQQEFDYLYSRIDRTVLYEHLERHCPAIIPIFEEFSDGLACGHVPRRLHIQMKRHLRRFYVRRGCRSWWNRLSFRIRRAVEIRLLCRLPDKQRFVAGGLIVAFVGGDGSGKTTNINLVLRWLRKYFDVQTFHLGRPRRSVVTQVIRGMLKIGRGALRVLQSLGFQSSTESSLSPLWWHYCVARDRNYLCRRARRMAAQGLIVVCDRWPLPNVMSMDGPQIRRSTDEAQTRKFFSWLADREERYYRSFCEPDCQIVLKLDPEIAQQRKPEEDAEFVFARGSEVHNVRWEETTAQVIDAGLPLDRVQAKVKECVWNSL